LADVISAAGDEFDPEEILVADGVDGRDDACRTDRYAGGRARVIGDTVGGQKERGIERDRLDVADAIGGKGVIVFAGRIEWGSRDG